MLSLWQSWCLIRAGTSLLPEIGDYGGSTCWEEVRKVDLGLTTGEKLHLLWCIKSNMCAYQYMCNICVHHTPTHTRMRKESKTTPCPQPTTYGQECHQYQRRLYAFFPLPCPPPSKEIPFWILCWSFPCFSVQVFSLSNLLSSAYLDWGRGEATYK